LRYSGAVSAFRSIGFSQCPSRTARLAISPISVEITAHFPISTAIIARLPDLSSQGVICTRGAMILIEGRATGWAIAAGDN